MGDNTMDLKPCPFCGSKDVAPDNSWTAYYRVECEECCAEGPPSSLHVECPDDLETAVHEEDNPGLHSDARRWACELWNEREP